LFHSSPSASAVGRQTLAETAQVAGQAAADAAQVHTGIPATEIDEAEPVAVAHQCGDALRLAGKAAGAGSTTAGLQHFVAQVPR